jgi:hypothetical protein
MKDTTAENILDRLGDLENYPHEPVTSYEEFEESGKTYYFTPGGFLYRKDSWTEELGGSSAATSLTRPGTTGATTASRGSSSSTLPDRSHERLRSFSFRRTTR